MSLKLSRRRFLGLSVVGALGAGTYGLAWGVRRVRESAARMKDT